MSLNIGLVTLNAKFIHAALGLRYLRNAAMRAGYKKVWLEEYVINQPIWKIAADIQKKRPDVVGISIYIWNRVQSFQLIELLKKQNADLSVVIGGPEVSFEEESREDYTVIGGEGEDKWIEYLGYQSRREIPPQSVLERWKIYGNDFPELYPPYIEKDFPQLQNRMAYIETSRGCPYLCSFCLSALDKKVRYFDDALIRDQIERLVRSGVKTVKFIDRTFNIQAKRVISLMQWLSKFEGTGFHFEVVGDILSEEVIGFLESMPPGMFQFEIGVQTVDDTVQNTIQRKQNNHRLYENIKRLVKAGRIHLHCDLIFGLPGETLDQILESFTEVFYLKPHELQLGFLKFLPGAPIKALIEANRYQFQSFPPYEVIANKDLSAEELIYLKQFNEVFDLFYNSKRFKFTIDHLLESWTPIKLFDHLLHYLLEHHLFNRPHSLENQYRIFIDAFSLGDDILMLDHLRLDYVFHQTVFRLPPFLQEGLPETASKKFKVWSGDRKSPVFPFIHEIIFDDGQVLLKPVPEPVYYAIIYSKKKSGYMTAPTLVQETKS